MEILTQNFKGDKFDRLYFLEENNRKLIEQIVARHADRKEPYYIMFVAKHKLNGRLNIHIQIEPREPFPLLGTICYRVDNERGELTRLWILPFDMPIPDSIISDSADAPNTKLGAWNIEDDAKRLKMPVLYGGN